MALAIILIGPEVATLPAAAEAILTHRSPVARCILSIAKRLVMDANDSEISKNGAAHPKMLLETFKGEMRMSIVRQTDRLTSAIFITEDRERWPT